MAIAFAASASTITKARDPRLTTLLDADQKTLPRASVIIVNHNGRMYLRDCLHSLLQDCRCYEIILVDNASTDGSAEYVERVFPEVQVIRNKDNHGFGQGNNLGARWAKGEYLAFLNPDTAVESGWLEALIKVLEANPQVGLVTPKILLMADPERINTCGSEVHCTGLTLCRGMGMDRNALTTLVQVDAVSGAAFAMRKEVFEALEGFDETFFLYMEDTDLSWRARLAGYRCLYVPQSVVRHDYTLRFGPHKTFYQERNRYLMLLKSLQWRTLLLLLPLLLLGEVVTWGFVLLRERRQLTNKLRAYVWIIKNWHLIMQRRRRTQALRKLGDRDLIAPCTHRLAFEQTGSGAVAHLAHLVFDPLFFLLHRSMLASVWW
jgi:GT2 family glycosyltransferase